MKRRFAKAKFIAAVKTRGWRGASLTESLITVPFTEPRSSTRKVSPSSQIRAWRRETLVSTSKRDKSISGKMFECGSARPTRLLSFFKMKEASSSVVPATTNLAVGRGARRVALAPPRQWLAGATMGRTHRRRRFVHHKTRSRPFAPAQSRGRVASPAFRNSRDRPSGSQDELRARRACRRPRRSDPRVCIRRTASESVRTHSKLKEQSGAAAGSLRSQRTADYPGDQNQLLDETEWRPGCRRPSVAQRVRQTAQAAHTHRANRGDALFFLLTQRAMPKSISITDRCCRRSLSWRVSGRDR